MTYVFERTFITDFRKVDFEILERARIIGDYVHDMAEIYALHLFDPKANPPLDEEDIDPALVGFLPAIKSYFEEEVEEVILTEPMICDPTMGYAGRPDIIYRSKKHRRRGVGMLLLDDYKTPERLHPATALQTAAYKRAAEKNYNLKIDGRGGVKLRPDGSYTRTAYNDPRDFHVFAAALAVTSWKITHKVNT